MASHGLNTLNTVSSGHSSFGINNRNVATNLIVRKILTKKAVVKKQILNSQSRISNTRGSFRQNRNYINGAIRSFQIYPNERVRPCRALFFWKNRPMLDSLLEGVQVVLHGIRKPEIKVSRKIF